MRKQHAYSAFLKKYLKKSDYALAEELNAELQKSFGLSPEAGRKVISRTAGTGEIISSKPVTFGKGQFVYVYPGKELDMEMITKIAKKHRPSLYRLIVMLAMNDGVLSYYEALKITASPLKKSSTKQDSLDKLIKELKSFNLVTEVSDETSINYIVSQRVLENTKELLSIHRVKMEMDGMFVLDVLNSLKRINIIDNLKFLYRNKKLPSKGVDHNNLLWDAVAYTKTTGINQGTAAKANAIEKQTFVGLDIVVSRAYTEHDLQGFYERIQIVLNSSKESKRKVLPIIVFSEIDDHTLNKIQKLGFLSFDLGTIYGSRIYEVIKKLKLIKVQDLTGESHDSTDKIEDALSIVRTSGQEDNLSNIKGDLFEFLLYRALSNSLPGYNINQGEKIKVIGDENKVEYEYDYICRNSEVNETVIVELKGFKSTSVIKIGDIDTKYTLKWFWGKTFPVAKKHLLSKDTSQKITGCYITTAKFNQEGIEFLNRLNEGKSKPTYLDTWYDGEKLIQLLEKLNLKKVKTIVERYYIQSDDHSMEKESKADDAQSDNLNWRGLKRPRIESFLED